MNITETEVLNELRCDRPMQRDIFVIYRVRYTRIDTRLEDDSLFSTVWRQEYGGFNGEWREYEPMETFDYDFAGVMKLDGRDYIAIRSSCSENMLAVRKTRAEIRDFRDMLDRWLYEDARSTD